MPKNNIATIWISGVTVSGKTTLGELLYDDLISCGNGRDTFFSEKSIKITGIDQSEKIIKLRIILD